MKYIPPVPQMAPLMMHFMQQVPIIIVYSMKN